MTDCRSSLASSVGTEMSLEEAVDAIVSGIRSDLRARGVGGGLGGLLRALRAVDRNGDGLLSRKDLAEGLSLAGAFLALPEVGLLVRAFAPSPDATRGTLAVVERGFVPAEALLDALRAGEAVSERRMAAIGRVADALGLRAGGGDGSGEAVSFDRMVASMALEKHPDVRKGLRTCSDLAALLRRELADSEGLVTREAFEAYWKDVSVLDPSDASFVETLCGVHGVEEHPPSSAVAKSVGAIEALLREASRKRAHGTETERSALARLFRAFDARGDGDGLMDMDEFAAACEHMAVPVPDGVRNAVFLAHAPPPRHDRIDYRAYAAHVFADEEKETAKTGFDIGGESRLF